MNFVFYGSSKDVGKHPDTNAPCKAIVHEKIQTMQYYHMAAGNPSPGGVPEKQPPPKEEPPRPSGPEITPPPAPPGPPPPVPNEIPDHDIKRSPPNPKADKERMELEREREERADQVAEQDREDVQERSPDLYPDRSIMETGDSYDEDDAKVIPEE